MRPGDARHGLPEIAPQGFRTATRRGRVRFSAGASTESASTRTIEAAVPRRRRAGCAVSRAGNPSGTVEPCGRRPRAIQTPRHPSGARASTRNIGVASWIMRPSTSPTRVRGADSSFSRPHRMSGRSLSRETARFSAATSVLIDGSAKNRSCRRRRAAQRSGCAVSAPVSRVRGLAKGSAESRPRGGRGTVEITDGRLNLRRRALHRGARCGGERYGPARCIHG